MHRFTKADVRKAFERYQRLTGDTQARLVVTPINDRVGTRYQVINARTEFPKGVMLGAFNAFHVIEAVIAGWHSAERGLAPEYRVTP